MPSNAGRVGGEEGRKLEGPTTGGGGAWPLAAPVQRGVHGGLLGGWHSPSGGLLPTFSPLTYIDRSKRGLAGDGAKYLWIRRPSSPRALPPPGSFMRCLELGSSAFGALRPSVWLSPSSSFLASPGHLPASAKSRQPSQRLARPAPDQEPREGGEAGREAQAAVSLSLFLALGKDPRSPFRAG